MQFEFSPNAKEQYEYWTRNDDKILTKIHELLESISENPFDGLGKPEPLKFNLRGYWSRRISAQHRLVYKIEGTQPNRICLIVQCRFHY